MHTTHSDPADDPLSLSEPSPPSHRHRTPRCIRSSQNKTCSSVMRVRESRRSSRRASAISSISWIALSAVNPAGEVRTASTADPQASATQGKARIETSYRHLWDQLISAIVSCCVECDVYHHREATLFFSENPCVSLLSQHSANADPSNPSSAARKICNECYDAFIAIYPPCPTDSYRRSAFLEWMDADMVLRDTIQRQSHDELNCEQTQGTADGIITVCIPDAYSSPEVAKNVATRAPSLARASGTLEEEPDCVVRRPRPPRPASQDCKSTDGAFSGNAPRPVPTLDAKQAYLDTGATTLPQTSSASMAGMDLFDGSSAAGQSNTLDHPLSGSYSPANYGPRSLDVPILSVAHAKCPLDSVEEEAATEQNRLQQTAMLSFIRLFGIRRFPVFGLVTSGSVGVMTCAWVDTVKAVHNTADVQAAG
ncbi:hypothetical protein C8T65DRAFT_152653 [Cerioporus squamosus]|nr:hypothetical protein C8T65DRAFT_152653 [Cerioporus squamosus]